MQLAKHALVGGCLLGGDVSAVADVVGTLPAILNRSRFAAPVVSVERNGKQ